MAKAGFSITRISNNLNIRKSTTYYYARNCCRKMTKFDSGLINEHEKGYIVGLFLGDGSLNRGRKEPRFFVRFSLDLKRDCDIASELTQIVKKAGKKLSIFPSKSTLIVKICSKEFVKFLQEFIVYEKGSDRKSQKILLLRENWPRDFQYGVLAGIIDSDGHVHRHLGTEIKTVSKEVFGKIVELLNSLGIAAKTNVREATRNSYFPEASKDDIHFITGNRNPQERYCFGEDKALPVRRDNVARKLN